MKVTGRRASGILMAGVLLITACSPAAPAPSSPMGAASGSPSASGTTSGEKVSLDLWVFEGEDGILPRFKEGFESSHPNITLEVTLVPEDLYVTKLDTAFAAGSPPDIALMYEMRWLKSGAFLPLDDLFASSNIDLARYAQGPLGGCQLDGELYCLGSYLGVVVLLYDRQLFDAANLPHPSATVPMSVDEYAQVATTLAKPDADMAKRVWGGEVAPTHWWMDTANLFSEDGRSVVGLVDDEATIHAWNVLGKMARDGVGITGPDQEAAGLESTDLLASHQLAMAIGDNTAVGELQEQGVDVGVAPLPTERAGDPVWASTWMDMWAVPTKASHPDQAKELVAWIATQGNEIRADAGAPPLDLQLARDSDWAAGAPERQTVIDLAAQARQRAFVPGFFSVLGPILEDAFTRVIETGDAASALQEAAPLLQEDLDREWEAWENIQ
jgi:multiple sugar transport system substrate-binding protein